MRVEHRLRRLVVPFLVTTVGAALLTGAVTSDAAGQQSQPPFTPALAALTTSSALPRLGADADLPSTTARREARVAAERAEFRAQVTRSLVRRAVVRRAVARPATTAKPARSERRSPNGSGSALDRAIARIPGYAAHRPAHWVSTSRYGHYGATDLATNNIYVNPGVPSSKLDSVVRHEWSHILSVRAYGGSYTAMMSGTNRVFGGSGMTGAERAADCMAIQLGASWTHYTSCSDSQWRAAAARLLSGRRP